MRHAGKMWLVGLLLVAPPAFGQSAPPAPNRPWSAGGEVLGETRPGPALRFDPTKTYSLTELIDLAQRHNPDTRVSWERARAQAAALGVARSELYPTLTAAALTRANRSEVLVEPEFRREDIRSAGLVFDLTYMVFDFGGRTGRIDAARAETLAANFAFNDTHRKIIFQVSDAYYRLLNAAGQEDAARASLANARTVQRAAEERLQNGLATLPDVLEARSAAAQADYELQATLGAREIALGNLATALGAMPSADLADLNVQPLDEVLQPDSIPTTVDASISRAFAQRPDLMQQLADIRAAEARSREARAALYPSLNVRVQPFPQAQRGRQDAFSWTSKSAVVGWAGFSLDWTVFDGGARNRTRDQIANDVRTAYSQFTTALRRRQAASALLESAGESYAAALESYTLGLRSLLDVAAAQRTLAEAIRRT